ncbi:hypothetical protein CEQ90_15845 [Lewinellaceae bacterium SD302]|nr:hypothetical protein CEQ90_15845 [Lewinellaceae bacterium SD302]
MTLLLTACSGEETTTSSGSETDEAAVVVEPPAPKPEATDLGIKAGDVIADNERLQAGELRSGEGEFDVFYLKNEAGQRIGYVIEDFDAPGKVGDIFITNAGSTAPGAKGIKVGQSWADLQAAFPDIEAYGSEVESRTYAITDELSFRLSVMNNQYEVEESTIPADTKITEILIKAPR